MKDGDTVKKRYLITYDLNAAGQDYESVIAAIKSASDGVWCSYWKSSFLIRSDLPSAGQVLNKINPYLDANDKIIIMEVKGDNGSGKLLDDELDYVKNCVFSE